MSSKEINQKIDKTVEWLKNKVKESGTKGLIVGLSGGIDSSVVAFLLKKAFPEDSMGVILPCKSHSNDATDAEALAKACGITYTTIDLTVEQTSLLDKVVNGLEGLGKDAEINKRLTDANLRARMRMSTIYAIANSLNYLVVGTDNAAEVHTGYFTKYGDGGVDIIPLANLTKREVYQWGKELGVPSSILDKAPSAGLWEGQTDEKEMGTTYDMIDDMLEGKDIPKRDQEIIDRLHARSEHKRHMPAAPPKF